MAELSSQRIKGEAGGVWEDKKLDEKYGTTVQNGL